MNPKKNTPKEAKKIDHSVDFETFSASFPKNFGKKIKEKYAKLKDPEVPFETFLSFEKLSFKREAFLKANPKAKYSPRPNDSMTPCGNGDLETLLNPKEWQGAAGDVRNFPSSFIEGFHGGAINDANAHHTWVGPGTDPNVPINTTAPNSMGAVRIGNMVNGFGSELISKTFIVTPEVSTISFWYAVVMQNPIGHPISTQPLFWVRVTDAGGTVIPGAFDFGGGSDKLIADTNNPMFKTNGMIVYRDWSCAQIDLTTQIGKQVTIEFITGDCGYGGHWGYAYLDRYCDTCDGSPTGSLSYDCKSSDHCGKGKICFEYTLPFTQDNSGATVTGDVEINLDIYQSGIKVATLSSPTLSSGTNYCFQIDSGTINGLNMGLPGFDFMATGTFSIMSFPLGNKKIGRAPNGVLHGINNDYKMACESCDEIAEQQESRLNSACKEKANLLTVYDCNCPDTTPKSACDCLGARDGLNSKCSKPDIPNIEPCISISWGDTECDCMETTDFEVACITVCNCYENVTFEELTIQRITILDEFGKQVAQLPNGKDSVEVLPSGPLNFGDLLACEGGKPTCKSREIVLNTLGAKPGKYHLLLRGICYKVRFDYQKTFCAELSLCGD